MPLKTNKRYWEPSTTFSLFAPLSFAGALGATKIFLDFIQPNHPDNIKWALAIGVGTGILIGGLTSTGVLTIRTFKRQKR